MAINQNNAICAICGRPYHVCNTCEEEKMFKPWRSVVDTIDHFKIYIVIHGFTTKKSDKSQAQNDLNKCNLSDIDTFAPEIKTVIREILQEGKDNEFDHSTVLDIPISTKNTKKMLTKDKAKIKDENGEV